MTRSAESSTIRQDHTMSEGIATSASEINAVSGKPRPKEITRSDVTEIIARAAFDGLEEHGYYVGSSRNLKSVVLDGNFDLESVADDILTALSAAGLAVAPKEATQVSAIAVGGFLDIASAAQHSDIYRAMVAAEDLAVCKESLHTEQGETAGDLVGERG